MDVRIIDLPWLPDTPSDFRQQVRRVSEHTQASRDIARRLSACRLTSSQLHVLGKAISNLATEDGQTVRLGVLSNSTVDLLYPAMVVSALRHGVWMNVVGTPFDQVAPQAFDSKSKINRSRCHFVLLSIDHRGLPLTAVPGDPDRALSSLETALRYIDSIRQGLENASECTVIVQTIPQIQNSLFGSLERNLPGTLPWLIDQYNRELRAAIAKSAALLLDTSTLAEFVGVAQWHDPVQWTLGKFAFAQNIGPLYSEWLGRLIAAARGKARKCLVLDLDNTLWGGVIGDDGLEGIVLGNGSAIGEAYLDVQRMALALRGRGIILAVSTKNDENVARNAFRSHPEMLLKEEHFAVFQANWEDKATNLRAIAKTLNIGVDSLVLIDDNPVERAQVRSALPDVAIPELPVDPAFYVETVLAAGYFEAIRFTVEDRARADQYQANSVRTELLGRSTDLESYLYSLEMRAFYEPFNSVGRARITQLINKTNQFNLTTHRYTEAEVAAFETSTSGLTLQIRLVDRFGDNGMISVVICVRDDDVWIIDTWLMSCRVLNRQVEHATLNYIVLCAKAAGVGVIVGRYLKSERNSMVKDHYCRLGFAPISVTEEESTWQLDVSSYNAVPIPIEITEATDRKRNVDGGQVFPPKRIDG